MNTTFKIGIIIGSVRPTRFAEKPAQWILETANKLEGVQAELVDLKDYPMPFYEDAAGPSHLNGKYSDEVVKKFAAKIVSFDAYVMVSPEYNHSTSGVLKNALDHIFPEFNNKSVGFVSYGSVGGARAVEHLRLISIELMMAPVRQGVHIPANIVFGGPDAWNDEAKAGLQKAADTMLSQVMTWGKALKSVRA